MSILPHDSGIVIFVSFEEKITREARGGWYLKKEEEDDI